MTTLETLLKQVEELDAKAADAISCQVSRVYFGEEKDGSYAAEKFRIGYREGLLAGNQAAPILVEVIRKLVEQRDYEHNCLVSVGECEEMDAYNRQLDAIVAKRLKGEE